MPSSWRARTTYGLSFPASRPALWASNVPPPSFFKYASAIWLLAELCVQTKRTLGMHPPAASRVSLRLQGFDAGREDEVFDALPR